jgi:hypothetical protein
VDACGRVMVDPLERRWLLAAPLDTSFGPLLADAPGGNDQASEVVVDGDGRIVVAGQWVAHGPQPRAVGRGARARAIGTGQDWTWNLRWRTGVLAEHDKSQIWD